MKHSTIIVFFLSLKDGEFAKITHVLARSGVQTCADTVSIAISSIIIIIVVLMHMQSSSLYKYGCAWLPNQQVSHSSHSNQAMLLFKLFISIASIAKLNRRTG